MAQEERRLMEGIKLGRNPQFSPIYSVLNF